MLQVQVDKVIMEGRRYFMAPSEGLAGIELGEVKIVHVFNNIEDIVDTEVRSLADSHVDAVLSILDGDDVQSYKDHYGDCEWVLYEYTRVYGTNGLEDPEEDIYILPLQDFANHSIPRY